MKRDLKKIISQMTLEEKAGMCSGLDFWHLKSVERLGIPEVMVSDGPHGLRKQDDKGDHLGMNDSIKAVCFPPAALSACSFDRSLMEAMGETIGREAQANDVSVVLGPAVNIKRSPLCGRNFEYYSEDGVLSGDIATSAIQGAQAHGVYAYMKHFALNDQETNRCSFLLTFASEQTIREGYLKAFELATKGFEGKAMAVMSSFNWIGTVPSCANNELLNNVLRGEWGFVGMVETDYDGSYGYMITDHCIRNGNDLMLGFNSAESNKLTDESATAVLAMRQACKNILYTVANSGYYADGNPATGMTNMTKLFVMIDVILAVVLIVVDTIVIVRWRKKKKQAVNE